ncbi:TIGR03089 family protein [Catellatospora sp. IY07-71]|uniref:TIGR03089 family protein n=1 Tax=Catellatospora sp. IY07-71 TaxID=2728827 RepID=UPI001BB5047E|nr:TIGR03089 family protein [Catellatospora sp. IY07-71]BCJ74815.1 TIGR03089 family protein [Catellatospora sp. IY07-71]
MSTTTVPHVPALLGDRGLAGTEAPLLTYCDDATGERVELSASELAGWASRTAALLHEGCGLGAGSRMAVLLPPHWQTAAVLLGAWSAGIAVSFRLAATAGLTRVGDETGPLDAVFAARSRIGSWLEDVPEAPHRFALGLAPGGAPLADVPDGYRDFIAEVAWYTDSLPGYAPVRRTDAASADGTTFREWGGLAHGLTKLIDLRPGDRLLVDAGRYEHPVQWLLTPLAAGASVVLCANLDPFGLHARAAAEGATRVLGVGRA